MAPASSRPVVYVLRSMANPQRSYVGYTNNLAQRLRRHNGQLTGGAKFTHSGRPWTVEVVVVGFGTHSAALSYEWAIQHPTKSAAARGALRSMPRRPGSFYRKLAIAQHLVSQMPFSAHPLRILQRGGATGRWWEEAQLGHAQALALALANANAHANAHAHGAAAIAAAAAAAAAPAAAQAHALVPAAIDDIYEGELPDEDGDDAGVVEVIVVE